ncbi:hypothetical protein ANTPLA_LOCUS9973 [Anthophora plagiata]
MILLLIRETGLSRDAITNGIKENSRLSSKKKEKKEKKRKKREEKGKENFPPFKRIARNECKKLFERGHGYEAR